MDRYTFIKLYAFDKILKHLSVAKDDPRLREQKRAQVAIKTINEWLREGERTYEKERKRTEVGQEKEEKEYIKNFERR